ncbi:MAG: hypothetical protein NTX79_05125 [Candidatus Micrarchaeota archaeon]|nr:hypothetical protein [Candidatus Micrarchaeota archaeon]
MKMTKEGLYVGKNFKKWNRFKGFRAKYPLLSLRVPMVFPVAFWSNKHWIDIEIKDRENFDLAVAKIGKYLDRMD